MNKEKIIKKSEEFSEIINNKKFFKNIFFSLYYKESKNTLFGITVPKKIGHAVTRNKLKRQTKNIIMTNEKNIQTGYNYVIIIKEEAKKVSYQQLSSSLLELFEKVRKR